MTIRDYAYIGVANEERKTTLRHDSTKPEPTTYPHQIHKHIPTFGTGILIWYGLFA